MKFFGYFCIVALTNILSVLAGPQPPKYIDDGTFEYFLSSYTASIIRVMDNDSKELVITPYAYYEGERYNVTSISKGLDTSKVENIIIHNSFKHRFYLGDAIAQAKNLRSIEINAPDVVIYDDTFEDVSRSVILKGEGIVNMALKYATDILVKYKNNPTIYDSSVSVYQRQQNLYELARTLKNKGNLSYSSNVANASSGIHTLIYKEGNMLGVARAFRIFALAKGFNKADIKVVGDNKYYNWNIIKLNNSWFNFDVIHTTFKSGLGDVSVFYTDNEYNNKILKPFYGYSISADKWIIYNAEYGYSSEISGPETENLAAWIEKNRWSGVYHGHGRG